MNWTSNLLSGFYTWLGEFYIYLLHYPKYYFGVLALLFSFVVLLWGRWTRGLEYSMGEGIVYIVRRVVVFASLFWLVAVPLMIVGLSYLTNGGYDLGEWKEAYMEGWAKFAVLVLSFPLLIFVLKVYYRRVIVPWFSSISRRWRVRQTKEVKTDIREEYKNDSAKNFDPFDYYKDDCFFLGLASDNKPIYISDDEWKRKHQKIVGPTQTGKGVVMGLEIDQAIRKNMTVINVDPKPDEHILAIMNKACIETGRKLIIFDMVDGGMTWEPFKHGRERKRHARLLWALGLYDDGKDGDFYKQTERMKIRVVKGWTGEVESLLSELSRDGEAPIRAINLLSELQSLDAVGSSESQFIIEDVLTNNYVVYIRTDIDDKIVIKATNILIQEIMQTSKDLYRKRNSHLFIFIDEIRFFVSDVLSNLLATISSFGVSVGVAYQSLRDLTNVDNQNLNAESVAASVDVNTKITISYAAANEETAEWMAEKSGTINKQVVDREKIETGKMGGDEFKGESFLVNEEVEYISKNMAKALPDRVGVLYVAGKIAEKIYTSWINVDLEKYDIKLKGEINHDISEERKRKENESGGKGNRTRKNKLKTNRTNRTKKTIEEGNELTADQIDSLLSKVTDNK